MESINLAEKVIDLLISLVQAGILALVSNFIIKKTYSAIKNTEELSKCGVTELDVSKKLYKKEMSKAFKHATSIKACYVTGENLFEEQLNSIEKSLRRTKMPLEKIEILICRPNTEFMMHIENIEKLYGERNDNSLSLEKASEIVVNDFKKINSNKVEIKYNDVFYFFPYMIAEYKTKDGIIKEVYTDLCIPPQKSINSISLLAKVLVKEDGEYYSRIRSKWKQDEANKNIVVNIEKNFEYIWEKSEQVL